MSKFLHNPQCLPRPCDLMGAARTGKRTNTMPETITTGITKCTEGSCCKKYCELSPGFLNNLPADGRCNCCGKHLSELKPFSVMSEASKPGLEEVLLVKNVRPLAPLNKQLDRTLKEFFGDCLNAEDEEIAEERLIEVFGSKFADDLRSYYDASTLAISSWECLECLSLDNETFLAMCVSRESQDHGNGISVNRGEIV
jgi:hypothetical protein